jgi:hypothetical protein
MRRRTSTRAALARWAAWEAATRVGVGAAPAPPVEPSARPTVVWWARATAPPGGVALPVPPALTPRGWIEALTALPAPPPSAPDLDALATVIGLWPALPEASRLVVRAVVEELSRLARRGSERYASSSTYRAARLRLGSKWAANRRAPGNTSQEPFLKPLRL